MDVSLKDVPDGDPISIAPLPAERDTDFHSAAINILCPLAYPRKTPGESLTKGLRGG